MSPMDRYAEVIVSHSKAMIVLVLLATVVVGSGAGGVDASLSIAGFQSNSTEAQTLEYVNEHFKTGERNRTAVQVVIRGEDVLSKESYLATLRLQQTLLDTDTVGRTLVAERPVADLASLIAVSLAEDAGAGPSPTLTEQITLLEHADEARVEQATRQLLGANASADMGSPLSPLGFLPTDHDPQSTDAGARLLLVLQGNVADPQNPSPGIVDAQLAIEALAEEAAAPGEAFAFGVGIVDHESSQATGDSFAIISPVAFLLVLLILALAYRDLLDVVLGLLGIVLVLVWMGGFMGWAGIDVTQILIAVPFLLIGLSIDYALHVVMRYREESTEERGIRESMRVGLSEVVLAIAAATVTTAVGFSSNVVSPIPPIREFGLVSAAGIVAAFVVFGALLPALKVELDGFLSGVRRWRRPAFGLEAGLGSRALATGARLARRVPLFILVLALVLSAGGLYGAANTDTTFRQEDFLPRDSPEWMDSLPEQIRPGDYDVLANAEYLNENFLQFRDAARYQVLVEGNVTGENALERLAAGRDVATVRNSTVRLASGEPAITGPLTLLESVASQNETVAQLVRETDTSGAEGVPDRKIEQVLDALVSAASADATQVIHREDGEYRAYLLSVSVKGSAPPAAITEDARAVATEIDGDGLEATATGQPVLTALVQEGLLRTLIEAFLITLVVILAFLGGLYRWRHGAATLGVLTLVPVLAALAWVLGTMYLLGINFTTETAIITSIAIGLGVDYSIHISERFVLERSRSETVGNALERTIRGTGGALLGSAATTTAGFGVLGLALVPSLQRFGIVTGVTIIYAFVASVLVLPSVLVLWTRLSGDDESP